jgi:hypothetical protein
MALSIGARSADQTQLRRFVTAVVVIAVVIAAIAVTGMVLSRQTTTPATLDAPTYVGTVHGADEAAGPAYVAPRLDGLHEKAQLIAGQQLQVAVLQSRFNAGMKAWASSIGAQPSAHPLDVFRGR